MRADLHSRLRTKVGIALPLTPVPVVFATAVLATLLLVTLLPVFFPFSCSLYAQRRRDPLNPLEIDQLRDAMLDPDTRLKLYVEFSRDRMTKLEQMRSDPKTKDRASQTHDMLEDFLAVYD